MEEADKDWMMIMMVGGWVFLLVPAHLGSPGQRAIKQLLLLCISVSGVQQISDLHSKFALRPHHMCGSMVDIHSLT